VGWSIVLSANVTSGPSELINVTEIKMFSHRYLKLNNSTAKEYFLTKFCGYFRNSHNPVHIILLGCIEIWHFYAILFTD